MSLGAGCRSPSLSGEPIPHTHSLCLQLCKVFACSWGRGGQSPAVGWEEALPWGTKGTSVWFLCARSSAVSQGGVGHPWALWWQSPRNGVRAGSDHPVPVLEIPVVKGGWDVLVQHFPLATLVVWHVPLCARVFLYVPMCVPTCSQVCPQVFSRVFFRVFPCVCTRVGVHTPLPSACTDTPGAALGSVQVKSGGLGVLGGGGRSCWRGSPWAMPGGSSVQCPERFWHSCEEHPSGTFWDSSSPMGLCPGIRGDTVGPALVPSPRAPCP